MAGVYLTYAAWQSGDGLGAQAQRIMGIFSAAKEFGFGYIHSSIVSIEPNPGDPHTSAEERQDYLERTNSFFSLPSDLSNRPRRAIHVKKLTTRTVVLLRVLHRIAGRMNVKLLVELSSSLPWSDQNPDTYGRAATLIRQKMRGQEASATYRVDVHIRRAVAPPLGRDGMTYDRYVPTAWYRQVLRSITAALDGAGTGWLIRIHTDLPQEPWKVPEYMTAGTVQMWKHHHLIDENNYLIDRQDELAREFSDFGAVEIAQDWDPLNALISMATADALVMCASSFSFVAGILRTKGLTICPVFFHPPLSTWLTIDGGMTEEESGKRIENLMVDRE